MSSINMKMKTLVEISSIISKSTDFFQIKDQIVDKMLQVVYPRKACINLFYNNNQDYAYLVCSNTLEYIKNTFKGESNKGVKFNFQKNYPKYIHEAVENKKIVYIKNIFEDKRAISERDLAKKEGYTGRVVFPLIYNEKVVGFMTCFLTKEDFLSEDDINFISSIASIIALSIEITEDNSRKNFIIDKLRNSLELISVATKKLYQNKNINEFLSHLSDIAKKTTNSKESIILLEKNNQENTIFESQGKKSNLENSLGLFLNKDKDSIGFYENNKNEVRKIVSDIDTYIYYKLYDKKQFIGAILCVNGNRYEEDDLNILSILSEQIILALQLYNYSEQNTKHKLIAKELNILNTQQKLIMNESNMECNLQKRLEFYHKPATVVGGDFYYANKIDEKRVAFIIADVMGHGIVANYMVAMLKGAFKTLCYQYKTAGEIATNLNKILYDEFDKMDIFVTVLIGVLDIEKNILSISNAGHYNPIIIDKSGHIDESIEYKKGIPIGILPDTKYQENIFDIKNYPMIFMFTDGILEIRNQDKEEFGIERLKNFIKNNYKSNRDDIIKKLKEEIEGFSRNENFDDDILILMLKDI